MSLAKMTAISTKTLSLLLERQRLQTLPSFSSPLETAPNSNPGANSLHLSQIKKNLAQLRSGILTLEMREGKSEAVVLLRNQYERMRGMLGAVDGQGVPNLDEGDRKPSSSMSTPQIPTSSPSPSSSSSPIPASPAPIPSTGLSTAHGVDRQDALFFSSTTSTTQVPHTRNESTTGIYTPYTDDPSAAEPDHAILLQTQHHLINEQDQRLDQLSHSINRQHHISLQINDELDVHAGLLEELDTGMDRTTARLGGARRRLDRVAKGVKENSSVVMIGALIFVLLILIVVLKT